MNKKDVIISFTISLAAAIAFEATKCMIGIIQDWKTNVFDISFIIILITVSLNLWLSLRRYKAIMNKINIHGKEYYDIFEDIVYFQTHNPPNILEIDELKWFFDFTPNASQSDLFLDLHAKWEIAFTAKRKRIKEVKVGIHGGDYVSEESMNIEAWQKDQNATCVFQREQDDCTFLLVNLNTDLAKSGKDKITLRYDWEKFMITVRKDDYIYLFPYALANDMKRFELYIKHPYKCKATVIVLQHKWSGEYDKIEISNENSIAMKIEISEKGYAEQHGIVFSEIDVKNVYLVIFEKIPE